MAAQPEILLPGKGDGPVPAYTEADLDRIERRLDRLATTLDSAFRIPVIGVRVGADALLGLVPVAGDLAGMGLSGYLVLEARRLGAPTWLLTRMAANVAVDTLFGSVPIVGSVFDVMYKANRKNMALLREHLDDLRTELRSRNPKVVSPSPSRGVVR